MNGRVAANEFSMHAIFIAWSSAKVKQRIAETQ
jgi:hypothetical protein